MERVHIQTLYTQTYIHVYYNYKQIGALWSLNIFNLEAIFVKQSYTLNKKSQTSMEELTHKTESQKVSCQNEFTYGCNTGVSTDYTAQEPTLLPCREGGIRILMSSIPEAQVT